MSDTLSCVQGLYGSMDVLQEAINRVSTGWNDTVSSAINVNHINSIIQKCNTINSQIQSEASTIDLHICALHNLLSKD